MYNEAQFEAQFEFEFRPYSAESGRARPLYSAAIENRPVTVS